jgi:long-chain acyl-CoA synthetase
MAGAEVVYARSAAQLADDLKTRQPTVLISVPRIFEKVYAKMQDTLARQPAWRQKLFRAAVWLGWRAFLQRQGRTFWTPLPWLAAPLLRPISTSLLAQFGGRLRLAVCGGAALSPEIARTFLGLGLSVGQGYGMTESGPVVSVFRAKNHIPASVGLLLSGVEVQIGAQDELLVRGPNVMQGYWRNPEATRATLDAEGFLHTGDQARLTDGHLYITGRLKEIIVLASGEKVPPVDMEMAVLLDPLFEQVMLVGEAKPYLAMLVVLNRQHWRELDAQMAVNLLQDEGIKKRALQRINQQLREFPGYAKVRKLVLLETSWTVENGLLTSTLKPRRALILQRYAAEAAQLYAGYSGA